MTEESDDRTPHIDLPLTTTSVEVREGAYPSEVLCRQCRNLMLPATPDGATWECWVCLRRIRVVLVAPGAT